MNLGITIFHLERPNSKNLEISCVIFPLDIIDKPHCICTFFSLPSLKDYFHLPSKQTPANCYVVHKSSQIGGVSILTVDCSLFPTVHSGNPRKNGLL